MAELPPPLDVESSGSSHSNRGGRRSGRVSWSDDVDGQAAKQKPQAATAAGRGGTLSSRRAPGVEPVKKLPTITLPMPSPSAAGPESAKPGHCRSGTEPCLSLGSAGSSNSGTSSTHKRRGWGSAQQLTAHMSHMVETSHMSFPLSPSLWAVQSAPGVPPPPGKLPKSKTFNDRERKRLLEASKPEFWENLPTVTKLYFILSLLVVPLVVGLIILDMVQHQMACSCGSSVSVPQASISKCPPALRGSCSWQPQSTYLGLIVSTVVAHYTGFLFGGIIFENAHSLVASFILAIILLVVVLYFMVNEGSLLAGGDEHSSVIGISIASVAIILQTVTLCMAPITYKQMGWRTYSRCASDLRVKNPEKMWRLFARVNVFSTILKLDFMLSMLVMMTSLTVWIDFNLFDAATKSASLIFCFIFFPLAGCVVNLSWQVAAWLSVRCESIVAAKWTAAATPITILWTIGSLISVTVSYHEILNDLGNMGVSDDSVKTISQSSYINLWWLGVLTFLEVVARILCGWRMWVILSTYSLPLNPNPNEAAAPALVAMQSMLPQARVHSPQAQPQIHPSLIPLTKGAWIGKPSSNQPKKKRFFQLSSDGTTLRWSWNKYILMIYVDSVEEDEESLELTLTVSAEPDLVLKFLDAAAFRLWSKGLRKVLTGLLMPEGIEDDARFSAVDLFWHARVATPTSASRGLTEYKGLVTDESKTNSNSELRQAFEEVHLEGTASPSQSGRLAQVLGKIGNTTRRRSVDDPNAVRVELAKRQAMRNRRKSLELSCVNSESGEGESEGHRKASLTTDSALALAAPRSSQDDMHSESMGLKFDEGHVKSDSQLPPIQEKDVLSAHNSISDLNSSLERAKSDPPRVLGKFHSMQLAPEAMKQLMPAAQTGGGVGALETSTSSGSDTDHNVLKSGNTSQGSHLGASTSRLCLPVHISTLDDTKPVADQLGLAGRVDDVDIDDLQLGKFLGAGAEGVVFAAWYNETPVAVKKTTNVHELQMQVLAGSHDNIVSARGMILHEGELLLVMEYCPRGTLDTMIHHAIGGQKAGRSWDPMKVVLPMVRNIARGLLHLHKRSIPILHRDLKPGNIFVGHGLVMKIGDFGMSRQVNINATNTMAASSNGRQGAFKRTFTTGVVGTSVYSAPEVLAASVDDNDIDPELMLKADVYSFGVTLWEILSRKRPFDGMDHFEIQTAWLLNPEEMVLPPVKIDPSLDSQGTRVMTILADLSVQCTQQSPQLRPTAAEIVARLKTAISGSDNAV